MVAACRVLDESAKEVGVDFIGGFGALVEKGMTPGEKNLIDALPEALAVTDRICSSINVGSTKAASTWMPYVSWGSAFWMWRKQLVTATQSLRQARCLLQYSAGRAIYGRCLSCVGEPDVVIDVGVSGPGGGEKGS